MVDIIVEEGRVSIAILSICLFVQGAITMSPDGDIKIIRLARFSRKSRTRCVFRGGCPFKDVKGLARFLQ